MNAGKTLQWAGPSPELLPELANKGQQDGQGEGEIRGEKCGKGGHIFLSTAGLSLCCHSTEHTTLRLSHAPLACLLLFPRSSPACQEISLVLDDPFLPLLSLQWLHRSFCKISLAHKQTARPLSGRCSPRPSRSPPCSTHISHYSWLHVCDG